MSRETAKVNSVITVLNALNRGRVNLKSISKKWHSYKLNIQELIWDKNFIDGWEVDVYKNEIYLGTLQSSEETRGRFIIKSF